jgi:serine/threonine-protein kinase RsbW
MEARARLPAALESLEAFRTLVTSYAREHGAAAGTLSAVELALEEALVNIASHAYPDAPGEAEVGCRLDGDRLVIEILDWGAAFDPLTAPAPAPPGSVEEQPIGGLGIHLMRQVMDEVCYRREGDCNRLTLVKRLGGSSGPQAG